MDEELRQFVEHGREERNLEYKMSMNWADKAAQMKVIRTAMAMANIRDGGSIVFGVEEVGRSGNFLPKGMSDADFASFSQDDVQEKVNKHADPYVNLLVSGVEIGEKKFIVIQVQQFSDVPIVCKKAGEDVFEGQIFTRPFRKIETALVKSQTEMREILDIATENSLRNLHERLSRSGLSLEQPVTDRQRFETELENL